MTRWKRFRLIALVVAVMIPAAAFAVPLTTTNYRLDPDTEASFGGPGSSTSYRIVDSGGEFASGSGASPSYRLGGGYVPSLEHSLQLSVLPSGISAYYPLDTGIGVQAYDSGASSRHGLLHNAPTWATGKISGGLTYNGTTQYTSTSASFNNPTTFTLELWFKTNTTSGGRLIGFGDAATGASTNTDRHIYMTDAGNLIFGVNPAGGQETVTSASTYNNNQWHHVVATLGAGGTRLYVDGASVGTPDANTSAQNYTGYWRLANDTLSGWPSAPTSNAFAGTLDEVKIYSRELTSTEIANEYAAGNAGVVSAQTIPQITSGISQTALTDVVVLTDAGGYNLGIHQDHDLLHLVDGTTTISAVTDAIATPGLWTEGTTKGLGFSLVTGSQIDAKWGSNPNYKYAALPGSATTFHTRDYLPDGSPDTSTVQFRLDVPAAQKSGVYRNTATITATIIP